MYLYPQGYDFTNEPVEVREPSDFETKKEEIKTRIKQYSANHPDKKISYEKIVKRAGELYNVTADQVFIIIREIEEEFKPTYIYPTEE